MVLRRFGGILLLLMGAFGVAACGVGIFKTGSAEKELLRLTGQVLDTADNAFKGIRRRLDQIDASLARVRTDLKTVVSSAEAIGTDAKEGEVPKEHIAFTLDHEVKEKLVNARQLVDSAENTAGAVSHLLTLLDGDAEGSVSGKAHGQDGSLMTRIKGASGTLSQLPGMLERARHTALDLQQHPNSKQALSDLNREVTGMDKGLAEVQALGLEFREAIGRAENRCLYYREKTIRWIRLGSVLIPLLLIWLGAGQAALIILGGRLCVSRRQ